MDRTPADQRARALALAILLILVALCAAGTLSLVLSGFSWV